MEESTNQREALDLDRGGPTKHPLARMLIYALLAILLLLLLTAQLLPRLIPSPPTGPLPPPPDISAPQGEIPSGDHSLEEWAQYQNGDHERVGCGFIFQYAPGKVVAATTAHSLELPLSRRDLVTVSLESGEHGERILAARELHGQPGRPRKFGLDMRVDYLLLVAPQSTDSTYVLMADSRGAPQPGEQALLLSCAGEESRQSRSYAGDVLEVSGGAFWIVMHDQFDPAKMSGSPIVSVHTGDVIGMAVAATWQGDRMLIGAHPIGSLVAKAVAGQGSSIPITELAR